MKADISTVIVTGLKEAGINFVTSLPCTAFREVIPVITNDPWFVHIPVCNENDGVGICAGAWLGGKTPALLAENSGVVLGAHALMGLAYYFGGIPMLLVLDHRGDFGDGDGYWYFGSGRITTPILDSLGIPYTIVREANKIIAELVRGQKTTVAYGKPVAILLSGEDVW